ncbi:MAG: hypothetical protein FWC60_08345 [Firmicutes bacterium]|nr:hypothetical protein [Bacillota bacterium]
MNPLLAIFIVFLVYAIGDAIATFSKAYLSMILIASIIFMVAFWLGLPRTLFADAVLLMLNRVTIGMLILHFGSTIKLRHLTSDWKVVVISVVTCFAVACGCYFIGRLFIDGYYALAGAPIAAGGNVAYLIMQSAYKGLNRPDVETFAVLVLIFHTFGGVLVASFLCKKVGIGVREQYRAGTLETKALDFGAGQPRKKLIPELPEKFRTSNTIFAKAAFLVFIAGLLAEVTGVSMLVFALLLGFIGAELGFLEEVALDKAGGFNFIMPTALVAVFSGLAGSTPSMVASMLVPLVIFLLIGLAVIFVSGIIMAKIIGYDWRVSVIVGTTACYGFLIGQVVAKEVATSLGESEDEKKALMDFFLPKMLIGGVLSMFIVSAVAASIMSKWF